MPPESLRRSGEKPFRELVDERAVTLEDVLWLLSARTEQRVSFRELRDRTLAWQDVISSRGLVSGDRVGLLVADPMEFAVCFVSALASGLWVAPMDPTVDYPSARTLDERAARLGLHAIVSNRDAPSSLATKWLDVRGPQLQGG
ncbi:MAG TPA: hypothetical protein VII84_07260, partial [Acidimicrobiales bacterium]